MTEVRICKYDPLSGTPEAPDIAIVIAESLPNWDHKTPKEAIEQFYEDQAKAIAGVLVSSLPQATLERVFVALMERRLGLYRGRVF